MQKFSLDAVAREHLERATGGSPNRSSETIVGGHEHALRQTLVALAAGSEMSEHDSPGEATVHVLKGRVRLVAGQDAWEGRSGDLIVVPQARHSLEALEDSAVLLTVVKTG